MTPTLPPSQASQTESIRVCARFRPTRPIDQQQPATESTKVVVPLHQRLKMIKAASSADSSS